MDDINLKKINCFPNTFEMERVHFLEDINMEKIKCSPNVKRKTSCTLASYSTSVTNTVSLNHRGFFALNFFYLPPPYTLGTLQLLQHKCKCNGSKPLGIF